MSIWRLPITLNTRDQPPAEFSHQKVSGLIATAKRMKADGHTAKDIAKYLGVSRATLYRYLAESTA
ncbi:MAG TPA: helix-turn-helix domain-containing protein [Mycobacterium sp.]|nr:helix-turn-helix domain-containing protein [Mycobacterium sp.]